MDPGSSSSDSTGYSTGSALLNTAIESGFVLGAGAAGRYDSKNPLRTKVRVTRAGDPDAILPATDADVDEKWVEVWVLCPASVGYKILHDARTGKPARVRIYCDYDVVDREGLVLHQVRH